MARCCWNCHVPFPSWWTPIGQSQRIKFGEFCCRTFFLLYSWFLCKIHLSLSVLKERKKIQKANLWGYFTMEKWFLQNKCLILIGRKKENNRIDFFGFFLAMNWRELDKVMHILCNAILSSFLAFVWIWFFDGFINCMLRKINGFADCTCVLIALSKCRFVYVTAKTDYRPKCFCQKKKIILAGNQFWP